MKTTTGAAHADGEHRTAGGIASLYLAFALLAAIPYFLVVVDYPAASTAADKVDLIVDHYSSMYAVYLLTYVVFGFAVGVVALALWERLHAGARATMRFATAVGLAWAVALVASGLIFTYGMTTIHDLASSDRVSAVSTWRAVEPVAMALGGAGGEVVGGLWVLLVSAVAVRSDRLPSRLGWLGLVIGVIGIASILPFLNDATVAFGLLQIVWFAWLGRVLLLNRPTSKPEHSSMTADREVQQVEAAR